MTQSDQIALSARIDKNPRVSRVPRVPRVLEVPRVSGVLWETEFAEYPEWLECLKCESAGCPYKSGQQEDKDTEVFRPKRAIMNSSIQCF